MEKRFGDGVDAEPWGSDADGDEYTSNRGYAGFFGVT